MDRVRACTFGLGLTLGVATLLALVLGIVSPHVPSVRAQSGAVGVVDFYVPSTLAGFPGLIPERFAADQLSDLVARTAGTRFAVVPRSAMQQAEGALRWQGADVLHFARLQALAQAVGADRLIVGWMPLLSVAPEGGTDSFEGGGPLYADAAIVLQVFDRTEGRLVAESRAQKYRIPAVDPTQGAERALRDVLQQALPGVLRWLGTPAP